MNALVDTNNSDLGEGKLIFGYRIERVELLKEISSFLYALEHQKTGARHIHISNSDAENTFSVAFKTVPRNSTGVAHILEHTVLCGSEKFPVRDPFFSMLKRSLSTFMNAFTGSDWTMYPFSTQNKNDFYNLMSVYLDAAFFPRLDELSFKQEGHRLEVEENRERHNVAVSQLVYKGVVYNEMKGAMSSPDQVMVRSIQRALYPSTTYRYNSGGDPAEIPSLSYKQLKEFHQQHYHPSNSYFYTYGNLPLKNHLAFIETEVLKRFKRIDPKTEVASQSRWKQPRTETFAYPLDLEEDPTKKCQVCVAWLTADIKDTFEILVLTLLEQILLGNSASPLRKALIDSGLGSALCDGTGYDSENRDTMFVCGLKDVEQSAAQKVENIIFGVLGELADKGIDQKLIDSAIHQIEFHRKEITNTPYPYGIKLLLTFSGSWFHGADPARILNFEADMAKLQSELAKGSFFENRVREYFLDNPHRVILILMPDQKMEQKEEQRLKKELDGIRKDLSPSDIELLAHDANSLRLLQDSEEDISCLPTLQREDIPASVPIVKESVSENAIGTTIYNQGTSGIFYFAAAAGCGKIPSELLPMVPFFCYVLSRVGTTACDYTEMAQRIDACTGGLGLSTHARTRFSQSGGCVPFISFNAKCLYRNQDRMFDIIQELLHHSDFSDLTRLKNLLFEYRAGLESMIVRSGHRLAISLAARNLSSTRNLSETWSGVHQFKHIKRLVDDLNDESLSSLSRKLSAVGEALFAKKNFNMAMIGEDSTMANALDRAQSIYNGFEEESDGGFSTSDISLKDEVITEGWATSSAVSFVAMVFETVRMWHEDAAVLSVISKILRSGYLHREIREKGGAYGGFALYSPEDGSFSFASYRDPHIVATFNVFEKAADFILSGKFGDEDVKEAVLQVCSEIDKPDPPGPAARKAYYRKIISLSDDMRKLFKSRLLSLTRKQVLQAAERYFSDNENKKAVAVISGEEKLKAANAKLSERTMKIYRI